jgi:hypothetical protein
MSLLKSITFRDWASNAYGSKQVWNSYWESILVSNPTLSKARITIEVVFGSSRRVFVSTTRISTVSSSSGQVYNYLPYLEGAPTLSSEYTIGSGTASQRSFSLTMSGKVLEDAFDLINYNFMLAGYAEVSLQLDGNDYDQRIVIMRGDMDSLNFGNKNEYIEFTITDISSVFSEIIPRHLVDKNKFQYAPDDSIGERYPIVLDRHFAVPCVRLEQGEFGPRFMVCYGHDFNINTVYVDGSAYASTWGAYPHTIKESLDINGVPYTEIDFDYSSSTNDMPSGVSVYAEVRQKSGRYRNIIEVIKSILTDYSLFGVSGLDEVLFGKSKVKIGQIELQLLINGSDTGNAARAISFIEDTICNELPMISMCYTERGYGPVVTNRNAEVVGTFNAHLYPFIDRASGLQETSKTELFNSFTIRYHYNLITDSYEKVIKIDSSNNTKCQMSEVQIGKREHDIIESILIYDDESANIVAMFMADHMSSSCYYVEYEAFPILYFRLDIGDNILLTDEKLGFSDYTCTVIKKSYEDSKCVVGLKIWT